MSDKNDIPSWLDSPQSGGDENESEETNDANLPPWLRPQGGIKPIDPPPPKANEPAAAASDLPPWLANDPPPKPKTSFIGGAELSEDYLSGGDKLVDHVDSDISYDQWIEQQAEDRRPKSIDEEIPDLLSDNLPQTGGLGTPGHTGQLPDWFLGLEELDERDVPEWFKDAQEIAPPETPVPGEVAPWMRDMVQPEKPSAPPLQNDDDVTSFFNSMGSEFVPEEEEPVIDWFANAAPSEPTPAPEDDFFAQFGATPPPDPVSSLPDDDDQFYAQIKAQKQPPPVDSGETGILSDDDEFYTHFTAQSDPGKTGVLSGEEDFFTQFTEPELETPDDDDIPDMGQFLRSVENTVPVMEPDEPEIDDELPDIELNDDFFSAVAKNREETASVDVDDPDLSWFLNAPKTGLLPTLEEDIASPTQINRPPVDDNTLSWLSDLEGIITSATNKPEPAEMLDFASADDEPWEEVKQTQTSGRADEFTWSDEIEPEAELEPQEPQHDWLSAVEDAPPDTVEEDDPIEGAFFTTPANPPPRPRLSGMLRGMNTNEPQEEEPQPEPEPEIETEIELSTEWDDIPEPTASELNMEWENEPVAEAADAPMSFTDMLRDFKVDDAIEEPQEEDWAVSLSKRPPLEETGVHEVDMDDFLRGLDLAPSNESPAPVEKELSFTDILRGANDPKPEPVSSLVIPPDELDIPEDELYAGWLTDELLSDEEPQPAVVPAVAQVAASEPDEDDDDFFSRLETNSDANLIDQPDDLFTAEPNEFEPVDASMFEEAEELPTFEPAANVEPAFVSSDFDEFELPSFEEEELPTFFQTIPTSEESGVGEFLDFGWGEITEEDAEQEPTFDLPQNESLTTADDENYVLEWEQQDEPEEQPTTADALPGTGDLFAMFDQLEEGGSVGNDESWMLDDAETIDQMMQQPAKSSWDQPAEEVPDFDSLFGDDDEQSDDDLSMFEPEPAPEYDAEKLFASFDAVSAMQDDAGFDFQQVEDAKPLPIEVGDIDSYLLSLDDDPNVQKSSQTMVAPTDDELEQLFSQQLMSDEPDAPNPELANLAPGTGMDWLDAASVGSVSASSMARQMEDAKQPEQLTDRLKRLRQRADQLPAEKEALLDDSLANVLPGVGSTLTPAPIRTDEYAAVTALTLSPEQTKRVDLLKSMLALDIKPQKLSAISETWDSAYAPDLSSDDDSIVHERRDAEIPVVLDVKSVRKRTLPLERWLVAVVMLVAVIAPFFVSSLRIGELPPNAFTAGSRQAAAFDRVDALRPGELVLIGVEYGATAAAELDLMTDTLIRHVLLRGGRPVIISGNPVALLRTSNLLRTLNADAEFLARMNATEPLMPNLDTFVVRYLPGSVLGLRAFSENTALLILTDIEGQANGLNVDSLDDFALITLIAERPEDVRAYAEQIAPLAGSPLIAAVSYSAAPLTEPYADSPFTIGSPIAGLLVGYGDAYTYSAMIDSVNAVPRNVIPALPTPEPTLIQPTPEPPPEQVAPVDATPVDGTLVDPNATPVDGTLVDPNATPGEETPTEVPSESNEVFAIVSGSSATVRLRGGPGTDFSIVDNLPSGTRVAVLGYNDAGDWVNVRLSDGREGWISEPLLRLEQPQSSQKRDLVAKPVQQEDTPTRRATSTPRTTRTISPTELPTLENTIETTIEVTAEAAPEIAPPPTLDSRDGRWYAQTLGTVAAATLIGFGTLINLVRAIFRRRRSG